MSSTSAGMRVDHIDADGNASLRIHLWRDPDECNMCGALGYHHYAVPWYCGPVAQGDNEGGYKAVCERCYGRWEAWARQTALEKDAARYRWLKSRTGLELRSEPQPNVWTRMDGTKFSATHYLAEGGTQHAPADSLDATIDAAMLVARVRDA